MLLKIAAHTTTDDENYVETLFHNIEITTGNLR